MFNSSDRDQFDNPDSMDGKAFGLGLLLGAALGAGAALLMAPASGNETRRQLRRNARQMYARSSDAVGSWWEDADRSARRLTKRGVKKGRKAASRARSLVGSRW